MAKKVLHIIDNMCLGGAQRIVATLVENNTGHRLHSVRKTEASMGNFDDYTVTSSPSGFNLRSLIDCWKLLNKNDPDVIHCHLMKSKLIGLTLKILSRKDFTLVMHEHGRIWKKDIIYNTILNWTSGFVDLHIAVSGHTAKLLKDKVDIPDDKVEIIFNFVDRDEYNPKVSESFKSDLNIEIADESFTVGFGGRLVDRKGWRTVVSAAEETDDIQFLMSGSGTGEEDLKGKAKEIDNLHYIGFLDDVRSLFTNIDCFVLPSHWDPSPMVLYEVQSCGIPLICTEVHSIDELVEDGKNALMYPPENVEKLVEKLYKVKDDPSLRKRLEEKGVSNSKNYTYPEFQNSLEEAYSRLQT